MTSQGYLTLAFGPQRYRRMAVALARSLRYHGATKALCIVTDAAGLADPLIRKYYDLRIPLRPEYGKSIEQKLALDLYSPFDDTIFIDSDCIAYRNIDSLWHGELVECDFVALVRGRYSAGFKHPAYKATAFTFRALGIESIPEFNGGLYFFRKGRHSKRVFEKAREIFQSRERYGFKPHKGAAANDEALFGLSLAVHGFDKALALSDGSIMVTARGKLQNYFGINVLDGRSAFIRKGKAVEPAIIHFNCECQIYYVFLREIRRLEAISNGIPRYLMAIPSVLALIDYAAIRLSQQIKRQRGEIQRLGPRAILPTMVRRVLGIADRTKENPINAFGGDIAPR